MKHIFVYLFLFLASHGMAGQQSLDSNSNLVFRQSPYDSLDPRVEKFFTKCEKLEKSSRPSENDKESAKVCSQLKDTVGKRPVLASEVDSQVVSVIDELCTDRHNRSKQLGSKEYKKVEACLRKATNLIAEARCRMQYWDICNLNGRREISMGAYDSWSISADLRSVLILDLEYCAKNQNRLPSVASCAIFTKAPRKVQ